MAKPGDIILINNQLCLVVDDDCYPNIEDNLGARRQLRNIILDEMQLGKLRNDRLNNYPVITNIGELDLHTILVCVLKEKGLL